MTHRQEIQDHTDDIYNKLSKVNDPDGDIYKEYDSLTGKTLNCGLPQKRPMQIALENNFTQVTAPQNLENYKIFARGNCSDKFTDSIKYPEVNELFKKEYDIFNKLYINNLSSGQNSSDLVPTINDKNISCPSGYIPYVLEYSLKFKNFKYARFCAKLSQINRVNFNNIGDYSIFRNLENSTQKPCENNSCNTEYNAFLGFNLEKEPLVSQRENNTSDNNLTIILSVLGGAILLIFLIIVLLEHYPKKKMKV